MPLKELELQVVGNIVENEDGTIEFEAKSTDKWLPEEVAKKVSRWSPNLPVFYRHRTPQKPQFKNYTVVGRVLESRVVDGEIYNKYRIGGKSHWTQDFTREFIRKRLAEGKPIGPSITVSFFKEGETVTDAEPIEYSITHDPACKTCQIPTAIEMENPEELTSDEIKKKLDALAEREEEIKKKEASIKEKETSLAEKEAAIEQANLAENERIAFLEKENKQMQKENGALKAGIEKMESRIGELERKPYLMKLEELEDPYTMKAYGDFVKTMSIEQLEARIACLEKQKKDAPPVVTSTLEAEKVEASEKSVDEILSSVSDPGVRAALAKSLKGDG